MWVWVCCTWNMFVNEILVFILQLLPAFQIRDVLNLLRGGSCPLQLLKYALHMIPLFHLPCRLTERVWHNLPYPYYALLDFVLAFLTTCSATFGVFHKEPLLCHIWLVGETPMRRIPRKIVLEEAVIMGYYGQGTDCPGTIKHIHGWR